MSRELDWASRVQRLEAEVAGLRRAMSSRAVIEQAKGVLSERLRCTPDQAFEHLSRLSQGSNVKLADLAASIVASIPENGPAVDVPAQDGRAPDGSAPDVLAQEDLAPRAGAPAAEQPQPEQELVLPSEDVEAYRQASSDAAACVDLAALATVLAGAGGGRVAFARSGVRRGEIVEIASSGSARVDAFAVAGDTIRNESAAVSADATDTAATADGPASNARSTSPGRCAAFPIRVGDEVVGAVTFGFDGAQDFTSAELRRIGALAQLAQRRAGQLWTVDAPPIAAVLDAVHTPAMLLEPIREGDQIIDFVIAYANPGVPNLAGLSRMEQIGRRLLDTYPHLQSSEVFDAYVDVVRTGTPYERDAAEETVVLDGAPRLITVRRRAIPYGGYVLATWQRDEDRLRKDLQMSRMESLGHFGWASWDLVGRATFWSPGLYAIFNRDESRGPEPLAKLASLAIPADRAAVEELVTSLSKGRAGAVDFQMRQDGDIRPVRLIAEPLAADDGTVVSVLAVAQDLTERHQAADKISRVQAQLAEQRFQLASQREIATALRRVLYPVAAVDVETETARVVGRFAARDADLPFRGDFCDATKLADGHVLFAIGDSFGTGAEAGEIVARLLYPARALGTAGMPPSMILDVLNRDLNRESTPPLASLVVGRFCPQKSTIRWAQGGHLPPVRVRNDATDMIERPAGPALGLVPEAEFAEATVMAEPGDLIVWMTDGMVYDRTKPNADSWRELRRKLLDANRSAGVEGVLDLCQTANGDEACMLAVSVTKGSVGGTVCANDGCARG
jgi:PAS domain S-box-containing protein